MGYGYSVATGARTVMLEPFEGLEPYGEYENEGEARMDYDDSWQDMRGDILDALSDRWEELTGSAAYWRTGHPSGEVIARSGLHEMLLEEGPGGYGYAFLSIIPRDDLEERTTGEEASKYALACATLDRAADAVFSGLQGMGWSLSVPGGYTSSPYRPKAAA